MGMAVTVSARACEGFAGGLLSSLLEWARRDSESAAVGRLAGSVLYKAVELWAER